MGSFFSFIRLRLVGNTRGRGLSNSFFYLLPTAKQLWQVLADSLNSIQILLAPDSAFESRRLS